MTSPSRSGRPRASSREVLAEAACELFLERGYEATSVSDITRRAGVSRSSFFNYFSAKSDVLWSGFDEQSARGVALLRDGVGTSEALTSIGEGLTPDALALAITNADAMGIAAELDRDRAVRQFQLQREIAARLVRDGAAPLVAQVKAGALSAAVLASVWAWADRTAAGRSLPDTLAEALAEA
ncbi:MULTISPECIES: TetR/AcrR family transcriptional regulator [Microbacterium]|jgi:AcrR family transcriptional regulator|uniref:TetR/AcrR family transcriptional regulator n=1 Tax=Microbacterium TaxID=33882 RepID=UPI0023DCCD8D|nr:MULTISPECIES: TetR/AcrR family transcriptional regulator [Microbacterium]MDF2045708.1 TetR/AcrR family transcriptional regulator [Microbacterium sp. Kw_RZR3]MDQ1076733.1 AcrR family transcriptional regulator [Microbacterium sp. SORGH_AS_0969]MDQ1116970.1 AcrR family transcriptional regulator [Microbacterium testaceum]